MVVATASIRLQILRRIRDAVAPLFDGRAYFWRQSGIPQSDCPFAEVRYQRDTFLIGEATHSGRLKRELPITIDVKTQADADDEQREGTDETADEVTDLLLTAVEHAVMNIDWTGIGDEPHPERLNLTETVPFTSGEGQGFIGGTVRCTVIYEHSIFDSAVP